jgi:type II secretory pathway component PulF
VLRDDAILAIRFAHQTGTLGPIYRQLINSRDPASSNQINAAIRQAVLYGAITALVTAWSLTFLFTFIMPTLKLIQADAFTDLPQQPQPWALSTFDALGTLVLQHAPLWILAAVVLAWLILAPPSRRYLRRVLASRWIRGVAEVRTAEVLQLLATSVEQGRPVPAALSTLAQYHFDASVRHKLMAARIEAEHRDDVWKVLSDVHLLTAEESAAIAVASTEPSRVWTMRQLADAMLQRAAQRGETLVSLLQPMIVLPLASLVLLTCCAMIGFLVHLTGQSLP